MDFVAVPPGTAAPAALAHRGPDQDLEVAAGDNFVAALGAAFNARNAGGGCNAGGGARRQGNGLLYFYLWRAVWSFLYDRRRLARFRAPTSRSAPAKLRALWQLADG